MHQNATHLAPKRSAFSTKTQCYLLQNAVLSPAKRKVKCSKTQSEKCEKQAFSCFCERQLSAVFLKIERQKHSK